MTTAMKLSKANKEVKELLANTFPEYAGRTIRVEAATKYYMEDYWDGGTRNHVKAYNPVTKEASAPTRAAQNPFNKMAHSEIEIPEGIVMVEHSIFCGRDLGIRIYVNPANMTKLLS